MICSPCVPMEGVPRLCLEVPALSVGSIKTAENGGVPALRSPVWVRENIEAVGRIERLGNDGLLAAK